jgi:hypothetical protein
MSMWADARYPHRHSLFGIDALGGPRQSPSQSSRLLSPVLAFPIYQ